MYRRYQPSNKTKETRTANWNARAEQEVLRRNPELSGRIDWPTLSYMGKYLNMTPEAAAVQYCSRYA